MAFSPMDFFRKRKKVIFALLTIMCMFIFVFTGVIGSGGEEGARAGDWFRRSWLGRLFRSQSEVDEAAFAKVGGDALEHVEMYRLHRQRMATYTFVSATVGAGQGRLFEELTKAGVTEAELRDPTMRRRRMEELKETRPDLHKAYEESLTTLTGSYLSAFNAQDQVGQLGDLLKTGAKPSLHPRSLVLFAIWRQKARDLKINLNMDRVKDDLIRAAAGKISQGDFDNMTARLKQGFRQIDANFKTDLDTLLDGVKEELEVMIAQGVLLGRTRPELPFNLNPQQTRPTEPLSALPSPLDQWETYVKLNTNLEVGILELPVEDFLSLVSTEPGSPELRTFFDSHKSELPNELSKKAAFKLPKLYRIEFLYANLQDNTYYGKQAESVLAAHQRAAMVLQAVSAGPSFIDPYQFALQTRYLMQRNERFRVRDYGTLLGAGEPGPAVIAGRAAAILGAGTDPLALVATSIPFVRTTKVSPQPPHILEAFAFAPTGTAAVFPWSLAMLARIAEPVYEPLDDTKIIVLTEEMKETVRRDLLVKDFKELQAELDKWRKSDRFVKTWNDWRNKFNQDVRQGKIPSKPLFEPPTIGEDNLPYKEYLAKWAQTRDVRFDIQMEGLRPKDKLLNEEGARPLTILREAFTDVGNENEDVIEGDLAGEATRANAAGTGVFEARLTLGPFTDTMRPGKHRLALYWKAEEHPERVPQFDEKKPVDVEAMVRAAWKRDKARGLAETRMKELADKVRETKPDGYRLLKDLPHYHDDVTIGKHELSGFDTATRPTYVAGRLPSYIRDDKPTAELLDNLVKELRTPGQVMTAANQPESEFYVFVLKKRIEPQPTDAIWVKKFARDLPNIMVSGGGAFSFHGSDMKPLAFQVLHDQAQELMTAWETYELKRAGYNEEKGKKLAAELRQDRQQDE